MIDYETFAKIHDCRNRQGLTIAQTARVLGLHPQTVAVWSARPRFEPRRSPPRASLLDPFKPRITRLLDTHPYSAQQIFQRLREEGYQGRVTILRDYVRRIRPPKRPVYLKLHFAPGECAQVDWGAHGTVTVGNTSRRLSFFVMVLAFSRQMFVEFTVSQTMEHFLACHEHAFAAIDHDSSRSTSIEKKRDAGGKPVPTFPHPASRGVPGKIMVDNLKSAVLQRLAGAGWRLFLAGNRRCESIACAGWRLFLAGNRRCESIAGAAPVFNPRYMDFARHHGFGVAACNVARGTLILLVKIRQAF